MGSRLEEAKDSEESLRVGKRSFQYAFGTCFIEDEVQSIKMKKKTAPLSSDPCNRSLSVDPNPPVSRAGSFENFKMGSFQTEK